MKRRIVLQLMAAAALIALFTPVAQAGSGNGGQAFSVSYECLSTTGGTNVGDRVSILTPDGSGVYEPNAVVGLGVLACRQVQVQLKGATGVLPTIAGDHLTCYTLATQGQSTKINLDYLDEFFPSTNLTTIGSRYLCTSAFISFPQ